MLCGFYRELHLSVFYDLQRKEGRLKKTHMLIFEKSNKQIGLQTVKKIFNFNSNKQREGMVNISKSNS